MGRYHIFGVLLALPQHYYAFLYDCCKLTFQSKSRHISHMWKIFCHVFLFGKQQGLLPPHNIYNTHCRGSQPSFFDIFNQLIKIRWIFKIHAHFIRQFDIIQSQWYWCFDWPSSSLQQNAKIADPLRFKIIYVLMLPQGLQACELEVSPWGRSEPLRNIIVPKNTALKKMLLKFAQPGSGWYGGSGTTQNGPQKP